MGGLTSDGFDELSLWGQLKDLFAHTFQPLCCYLIGGFAFVTMLMKNHLMDNLSADYVRTAMARGFPSRMRFASTPCEIPGSPGHERRSSGYLVCNGFVPDRNHFWRGWLRSAWVQFGD